MIIEDSPEHTSLETRDLRKSQQTSGFRCDPKLLNDARRILKEVEKAKKRSYATIHNGKFVLGRGANGRIGRSTDR
jgi:hypothetical protein